MAPREHSTPKGSVSEESEDAESDGYGDKKCEFCDLRLRLDSDLIRHAELIHNIKLEEGYVGKLDVLDHNFSKQTNRHDVDMYVV